MNSNEDQIAQVEQHFGVQFPQDYRDFLGTTGSLSQFVPPADDFLVIDSLAELIDINRAGEFQKCYPGAVVIGGDGSRELLVYGFARAHHLW
ncbi:SMI1/KNR4 family protein [Streptomyces sp. NPDC096934]|uniref:SMI1/KNR4 family protein n=1 Tax=Streptomyces sp. NPDC096934 TaxID=3155551 RepID=UPI003331002D